MRSLLVVVLVLGCSGEAKRMSAEEYEVASLTRYIEALGSVHVEQRWDAAVGVSFACCSFEDDSWRPARARVRPRACAALERAFTAERDPKVLGGLLTASPEGCEVRIAPESIVRILSEAAPDLQELAAMWLNVVEPSPAIVRMLVDRASGFDRSSMVRVEIVMAMARFGEQDLVILVDALSDPDPRVRELALQSLSYAVSEGPLEIPGVLAALERIAADPDNPDKAMSAYAETIMNNYRARLRRPANEVVAEYLVDGMSHQEIRVLGLRRYFCTSEAASVALERLARGESGPARAVTARRARALRAKRCNAS